MEFLYLETSATPIEFILKSRRINYLHTLLSRSDSELTKKIYHAQKCNPIKGDWVTIVMEDLETVNINLDEDEIGKTKKSIFKKLVRKHVKDATFTKLKEMQSEHTKINTIKYESFKIQPYIDSDILTSEQISTLFNMRANTINGFKMCFSSMHRNYTMCKLGCMEKDSLQHCMDCGVISPKNGRISIVNLVGIFATEKEQKITVSEFIQRKTIRTSIIEENRAGVGTHSCAVGGFAL